MILNSKHEAVSVLWISLEYIASILQKEGDTLGVAILCSYQKWRHLVLCGSESVVGKPSKVMTDSENIFSYSPHNTQFCQYHSWRKRMFITIIKTYLTLEGLMCISLFLYIHEQAINPISLKKGRPKHFAKSLTAQDAFCLVSINHQLFCCKWKMARDCYLMIWNKYSHVATLILKHYECT